MKTKSRFIWPLLTLIFATIALAPWCRGLISGTGRVWFDRRVFGNILAPIAHAAFNEKENFQPEKAFDYVQPEYLELCQVQKNFHDPIILRRGDEVWVIMFSKDNSTPMKWSLPIVGYMLVLEPLSRPKMFKLVNAFLEPRKRTE
jgi:hypothetical protein